MKYNYIYRLNWILLLLVVFSGCEKDTFLYDTNQKDGVYFNTVDANAYNAPMTDSLFYAFGIDALESKEYNIPVKLTGVPNLEDRELLFEVVDSATTAVEGIHYSLATAQINSGEIDGLIPLTLYRNRDTLLKDSIFHLTLRLVENESFKAVVNKQFKLSFTDGLSIAPLWWNTLYLGEYSPGIIVKFFEFYRAFELINPDVYNEMIEEHGYYFENTVKRHLFPGNRFKTIMGMKVFIPLYDYYEANPEEKEADGVTMPDPRTWL